MLQDIKILIDIEDSRSDAILNIMIKDAIQVILNYCHIKNLPPALEHAAREIVINQFKVDNDGNVASIKRGDTQITYSGSISTEILTEKQKSSLNAYRKWRMR